MDVKIYVKDSGIQFLAVLTNALSVAGDAGSTATFKITSNTDWNITSDQTWLTLRNASGSNIASITVTVAANPATATRTATVTVLAEGMGSRVITVTQDVKTTGSVIYLQSGWNIISFNVIPLNSDMKAIFQPLIDNNSLLKVQDETGNSLEDYGIFGGWINNIGNMALTEAYKVKVSKNCQLSIEGIRLLFRLTFP